MVEPATDHLHTSTADTDASADLLGVQLVVHNTLDNGGQLGFNKGVAGFDKVGQECSQSAAKLKINNRIKHAKFHAIMKAGKRKKPICKDSKHP